MSLPFSNSDHHLSADVIAAESTEVVTVADLEVGNHIILHNVVVQVLRIDTARLDSDTAVLGLTMADTDGLTETHPFIADCKLDRIID